MKILFLGPKENATTWQRIQALKENGHELELVYDRIIGQKINFFTRLKKFLIRKSGSRMEEMNENFNLIKLNRSFLPNLIFITKGLTIKDRTLEIMRHDNKNVKIICYSLDDIKNPGNQSDIYLKAVPKYDAHFTSKTYNIKELFEMGARNVFLTNNSYSPLVHFPIKLTQKDIIDFGNNVSFVGGYEKERAKDLLFLAENGVCVRIWGNNWNKYLKTHKNLKIEYKAAYGKDYTKVVCASKISLGFLRKINRDVITTRTVEIPACQGFLLAERTNEQTSLFREGVEAEYFESKEEMLEKIKFYLKNEKKRKAITAAAYKRCMSLNLSYNDSMKLLIKQIFENK